MKINRYVKIGIVVSVALAALIFGMSYLKGINYFNPEKSYYAIYNELKGINTSSPVTINGYKVGQVSNIIIVPEDDFRIYVQFLVDEEIRIPDSTKAQIYSMDMLGSKGIQLIMPNTSNEFATEGDTLIGDEAPDLYSAISEELAPVREKTEEVMKSIDSVLIVIQYVFNQSTQDNIRKTFTSIKQTIQNLERSSFSLDTLLKSESGKITRFFTNLESISLNIKDNNQELTNIIENFSKISDTLAKAEIANTISNANKTLEETKVLLDKINKGEGSMGMLVNNDSLYRNVEKTAYDLDLLIRDIKENPKKYVRFSIIDF